MTDLITKTRTLIGDTSGTATQHFADVDVQSNLDEYQETVMFEELGVIPSRTGTGYEYKNFFSRRWFEGGTMTGGTVSYLQNNFYGTVTPDSQDLLNGRYNFNASQVLDLYITGKRYDVYAAAADLADLWIASLKDKIDFKAGSSSFTQSQQITNLVNLAIKLRGKSEAGGVNTVTLIRGDMEE
jgi:hypothetical protein